MESLISHEINLKISRTAMGMVNLSGGDRCQDAAHVITIISIALKLN